MTLLFTEEEEITSQIPPLSSEEVARMSALLEERRRCPTVLDIESIPKCYEGWAKHGQEMGPKR